LLHFGYTKPLLRFAADSRLNRNEIALNRFGVPQIDGDKIQAARFTDRRLRPSASPGAVIVCVGGPKRLDLEWARGGAVGLVDVNRAANAPAAPARAQ
jgi:hypothetical protein